MQGRVVIKITGRLLLVLAGTMILPLLIAIGYGDGAAQGEIAAFVWSIVITAAVGGLMGVLPADLNKVSGREGFAIVTLCWVAGSACGALPFWLSGIFPTYLDCYFETISGFTTTGASVLTDFDQPHGILFWRSLTHWLGGMGVVVFAVAILPSMGAAGFQLMRAEVPGPQTDRLKPRIAATAKLLYGVYLALTLLQVAFLWFGGMNLFESFCHTFGTIATGGFSTEAGSIGDYQSAYFEWVIIVFMMAGSLNFVQHYNVLRGRPLAYWRSEETRWCVGLVVAATVFIAVALWGADFAGSVHDVIRTACFQVLTIVSTTGYATADFDTWPDSVRFLLLVLMFVGGSAGSTAGGLKVFRYILLIRLAIRELRKLVRPRQVIAVKMDGKVVDEGIINGMICVTVLYFLAFVVSTLFIAWLIPDDATPLDTASSAVAATLGCVGPGLGGVGPTANYLWMPAAAKAWLCFCMLLGRLEVVTVLVLLVPGAWKR